LFEYSFGEGRGAEKVYIVAQRRPIIFSSCFL
jgi:hypothetical protein